MFEYLTIQWNNINLGLYDLDLKISNKPPSVFDIKILLRTLFRNSITLLKIITYNPQNGKVKPLIPFINYYQMRTHETWFQLI